MIGYTFLIIFVLQYEHEKHLMKKEQWVYVYITKCFFF